jgi:hypothetical protein
VSEYAEDVWGCLAVRHVGEGLGHLPQLLGNLAPLHRVEGGQLLEQHRGLLVIVS